MTTKKLREDFNLTQCQLAAAIGCSLRTLQGWDSKGTLSPWLHDLIEQRLISGLLKYRQFMRVQTYGEWIANQKGKLLL